MFGDLFEVTCDGQRYDINNRKLPNRYANHTACRDLISREWTSLASAEKSARALHRRYGNEVTITRVRHESASPTIRDTVGYIRGDALGRVWFDLSWRGAEII